MRTTMEKTKEAEAIKTKKLTLLFQGQFGISTNIKLNSPIACNALYRINNNLFSHLNQ